MDAAVARFGAADKGSQGVLGRASPAACFIHLPVDADHWGAVLGGWHILRPFLGGAV